MVYFPSYTLILKISISLSLGHNPKTVCSVGPNSVPLNVDYATLQEPAFGPVFFNSYIYVHVLVNDLLFVKNEVYLFQKCIPGFSCSFVEKV